jgi:O-antigen/teichoic acid export membrane protein
MAVALALLALAAAPDADLAARFALADVPGVVFRLAAGTPGAPGPVAAPCASRDPAEGPLCDIVWESAPDSWAPLPAELPPSSRVMLSSKRGQPLLAVRPGEVILAFAPDPRLRRWPYFNYFLHAAASAAAGREPPRFGHWPSSPLPGPRIRRVLVVGGALLWLVAFALYRFARRRGRARPDAAREFFAALHATAAAPTPEAGWARAGFARPLAGLLTLLGAMLIFVGPYFALQSVLATRVQPFPEADGLWRSTWDVLWIAWLTFDFGTQTAFVKYFAEHRATAPEEALRDVQFYVWWQVFARLAEASLLVAAAVGWMPLSKYALWAPFVALYGLCALPAVSGFGKLMCQALQRFDYFNLLDMAEYRILNFLVPVPFVLLGRSWGAAHPIYGEAFGAALGLGAGQLATNLIMLVLGLVALKLQRLPLWTLFVAQFDRRTTRRQLVFGVKVTLGQEPYRLTTALELEIIRRGLNDFPTWLGIRDLLSGRLIWLFYFAWGYYQSAVPALSEALGAGKRRLAQYYVSRYLQFGFLFSGAIFSLLLAVGPSYIANALGPQWGRSTAYLPLAAASGLLLPPVWLSDSLQQGAGRPGITTTVMLGEQGLRLLLYLLLVPRLQFTGLYLALLIPLGVKSVVGWAINHTRILPLSLPLWTTLMAPALAALANWGLWRLLVEVAAPTRPTTELALFFVAGAGSFLFTYFICGLVGGFDADALDELARGARMTGLLRPLCQALSGAAGAGARLGRRSGRRLALAIDARREAAEIDSGAAGGGNADPTRPE